MTKTHSPRPRFFTFLHFAASEQPLSLSFCRGRSRRTSSGGGGCAGAGGHTVYLVVPLLVSSVAVVVAVIEFLLSLWTGRGVRLSGRQTDKSGFPDRNGALSSFATCRPVRMKTLERGHCMTLTRNVRFKLSEHRVSSGCCGGGSERGAE